MPRRRVVRAGRCAAAALLALLSCAQPEPAPAAAPEVAQQAAPPVASTDAAPPAERPPLEPFTGGEPLPETLVPQDWLVLQSIDGRGRRPFRPDAVFDRYLLLPDQPPPVAGASVRGELGSATWQRSRVDAGGVLDVAPLHSAPLGWAYATVWSEAPRVMLAELRGASLLHVNGVPAPGDLYALGTPGLPVALRAGRNDLLVSGCRGDVSLRFVAPPRRLFATIADATLPDLVEGQRPPPGTSGAVLIVNASLQAVPQLEVQSGGPLADGTDTPFERVPLPTQLPLPPLAVIKVPIALMWKGDAPPPEAGQKLLLPLRVGGHPDEEAQELALPLELRPEGVARRVTYVSRVDQSVQEFALVEPTGGADAPDEPPGLVLALHGAGVDELTHARSYSPQPDFWICAPTNRRAYGFDWQDWGRRDAYDALTEALSQSGADPARVMLTGHSMGGHGAWHLAANDPDRFAAVAPSAGWRSFDTYGSRPAGKLSDLWRGADATSDTAALLGNLAQLPVFIVHGTADDNVPVSEARAMEQDLHAAGGDPHAHYAEGAGHWWDGEQAAGVDCVDWPEMWELFRASRRPSDPDVVDWTAADPGADARDHWVVLLQPLEYGTPCHVSAERRTADDEVRVATSNVRRLALFWAGGRPPARLVIDDQEILRAAWTKPGRHGQLLLQDGRWQALAEPVPPAAEKTPERSGPLKRAFDNGFVLVYGTQGNAFENASLLERARSDACEWWYRGNGCAPLLSDDEYLRLVATPELKGRNVVLFGNADSNSAWSAVVPATCPVQAHRGRIRVGERNFTGEDLAAAFVYPLAGDAHALVAVFADSGPVGTRLQDMLTPFLSGVGYPDWAVFDGHILDSGDGGVLQAGWFEPDWSLGAIRSGRLH